MVVLTSFVDFLKNLPITVPEVLSQKLLDRPNIVAALQSRLSSLPCNSSHHQLQLLNPGLSGPELLDVDPGIC
jgi:hypothetical protein